ncbi:MAG: response regulator transcription factor [Candidatus Dormibacteraeota bacterium]|nr:response regulator transcription factor [Candidatus Dormibacteraeota bacterium]
MDRILIVEDDEGIRETLRYSLEGAGYAVSEAGDGAVGLRTAHNLRPDLVLLDLMLPSMSGMDFCRAFRRASSAPIIMVTARDSEVDKIVGLELGADDYITKPFSVREVLARVHAVLRRRNGGQGERSQPEQETVGNFTLDRPGRRVMVDGAEVHLTSREFDLLSHLIARSGRVQSREMLLQEVWGNTFVGDRKTVDVHIRWLREKLADRVPLEIVTVRGAGYRLDRRPGGGPPPAGAQAPAIPLAR